MSGTMRMIWMAGGGVLCLSLGIWAAVERPQDFAAPADDQTPRGKSISESAPSEKTKPAVTLKRITEAKTETHRSRVAVAHRPRQEMPHTQPTEVLARLLTRLHGEALTHFYADPKLGMARMLPVFQQIARDWNSVEFSPGDLGSDDPIPFAAAMKRIHANSEKSFLDPQPKKKTSVRFPFGRIKRSRNWDGKKKVWEAKSVDLVGLILHEDPVVYDSTRPATTKTGKHKPVTRRPDDFEFSGLSVLESGQDLYARTDNGVIRLLGAVRAKQSCIACHTDKKTGDLLGAFSYTLREAKYERRRTATKRGLPILGK